jgi:hypothetical protein
MSGSLAEFFVATAQGQTQLVFQLLKVRNFLLYIGQFFLKSAPDWRTWLQAVSSQTQETAYLAEFESQALDAAYESQRLDVAFAVLAEAALCPGCPRQQRIALVEANRVNTESNLFRDDANLHYLGSCAEATPWSMVQSQGYSGRPEAHLMVALRYERNICEYSSPCVFLH